MLQYKYADIIKENKILMQITELEKQILKEEYPQLSLSDDLDIERYFELRKSGRLNEALFLYNNKLRQKYPDDKKRIELMSCYRKKSVRFQELLTENLIQLAQKTIIQIKQIIIFITNRIASLKINDVYSVVQKCEEIVGAISNDRFASISFTEKYARYAHILNFKSNDMKKSAELIRLYVTDTLSSVREYKDEQAAIKEKEKQLQNKYSPKQSFDFSKITFTKEQKNAIIISDNIKRIEDQVIAYTLKYWNVYANSSFENSVLLYSRKYKTNHFNIFQAVKIGRYRNWKDEEILQAVLLNVVNGYYYSISGDLYLQGQWQRVRSIIESPQKAISNTTASSNATEENPKIQKAIIKKQKRTLNQKKQSTESNTSYNKQNEAKTNLTAHDSARHSHNEEEKEQNILLKTDGSIAEIVRKITNANYKIHKGLFFENIRDSIRSQLNKSFIQGLSIFNEELITAENLIYDFFEENYENPFQNWEDSEQYKEVLKIGFNLKSIYPIITDWVNKGHGTF